MLSCVLSKATSLMSTPGVAGRGSRREAVTSAASAAAQQGRRLPTATTALGADGICGQTLLRPGYRPGFVPPRQDSERGARKQQQRRAGRADPGDRVEAATRAEGRLRSPRAESEVSGTHRDGASARGAATRPGPRETAKRRAGYHPASFDAPACEATRRMPRSRTGRGYRGAGREEALRALCDGTTARLLGLTDESAQPQVLMDDETSNSGRPRAGDGPGDPETSADARGTLGRLARRGPASAPAGSALPGQIATGRLRSPRLDAPESRFAERWFVPTLAPPETACRAPRGERASAKLTAEGHG